MIKKLSVLLLGIIIAFASLIGNLNYAVFAANSTENDGQVIVQMNNLINDESFSKAGTKYPSSASGWTGGVMDDKLSSNVAAGVISLKADSLNQKIKDEDNPYMLPSDFNNINVNTLISPFDINTDTFNVLMISTPNQTAYSFKSNTYDIKPNSYYKLSVLVYTPDYSTLGDDFNYGAFVSVSGDINVISEPINTYNTWQEYSIYFSGYRYKTAKINVSLQLGDVGQDKDGNKIMRPASGYVFFDKVLLQPLSYDNYNYNKKNAGQNEYFADNLNNNLLPESFQGDFETGFDKWENIENTATVNIDNDVYIPFGTQALKMHTNVPGYAGYRSQAFTIERHKYYHLGIWQNKSQVKNGSAFAAIVTKDQNGKYTRHATLNSFSQNLGSNSWLGNWNQGSFFIKGSNLMDKEVYLELWFGNSSSLASGTVYYDNITLQEILPDEFIDNVSSGTAVTFTDSLGSSNISNGNFDTIANYKEFAYPMPVASWNALYEEENEDLTITGIIRGDKDHFEENRKKYGAPIYPYTDDNPNSNLLMIANTQPSAYGYSTDITMDANSYKKISVSLNTQISSGYGAELVLRKDEVVIARHSKIDTEGQFKTYNFYVSNGNQSQLLTLEIWLGKEGGFNNQYYTSGHLFVDYVDAEDIDQTAYSNANGLFDKKYSFAIETFETFEETDSALKTPSNWTSINPLTHIKTVTKGNINLNEYDSTDLGGLSKAKIGTDNLSPYALIIYSPEPTAYGMKRTFPISYETEAYYEITVRIKTVDIPKGLGARIVLDSEKYYFDNINTEQIEFNFDNNFVDYKFFVNTGTSVETHNIEIWLGDNTKPDALASGLVVVDQITLEKIDETAYAEGLIDLSNQDKTQRPDNIMKVVLSESKDSDSSDDQEKSTAWWFWPLIVLSIILGLGIIFAIVNYLVPMIKNRPKKSELSYDRRLTINTALNKEKAEKAKSDKAEVQESDKPEAKQEPTKRLIKRKKYTPKEYKDEFED